MEGPVRSLAFILLLVAAVAFVFLWTLAEDAEAQLPEITIFLNEADRDQVAAPTATVNDQLVFEGCLTFSRPFWPPGSSVVIEMDIEMPDLDTPWTFTFKNPSHTFTASETQSFEATVTVPAGLPATTTVGPSMVFTASTDSIILYDVTEDTARVSIAQYYKMTRFFSTEPLKVKQNEQISFNLTVVNDGNGADTFTFEVTNDAELLFAGLTVPPIKSVRLASGGEANVQVTMQADGDAKQGQFKLNLTIKSEGSSQDPNYDETVTSGVEWNVLVEPSLQQTIWDNLIYIILAIVVVIVVAVVVVLLRRRGFSEEEEEEEEAPPPKKKRKKRPPMEKDRDGDETPSPRKKRPPPKWDDEDDEDDW